MCDGSKEFSVTVAVKKVNSEYSATLPMQYRAMCFGNQLGEGQE